VTAIKEDTMTGTVVLTESEWNRIYHQLSQEYPPSHLLMRSVMRRELGFTVRRHRRWLPDSWDHPHRDEIHLDFYNDAAETFFTIKYLHSNANCD
jgi:hypothetical protein